MKVIILLGRQGSGKGTQAKLLAKEYKFNYIGSGDILRSFYEGLSFSAKKTKQVLNEGDYMPTAVIFKLWMDKFEALKEKGEPNGIVLDGSPRKLLEAQLIGQALKWYEWDKEIQVVLIDISREEGFSRLTKRRICAVCGKLITWVDSAKNIIVCDGCGGELITRPDDTADAIKNRLDLFEKETVPVIEYYKKQGKLKIVNGEQGIEAVHKDLKGVISK